jgi:hypothetical protein
MKMIYLIFFYKPNFDIRYLHPYEDFYRKLGSTVCDLPSLRQASSGSNVARRLSSTDSHRQVLKQRYYGTPTAVGSAPLNSNTPAANPPKKVRFLLKKDPRLLQ